ncbi:MAG TPA: HAD hydrolase-like protein, partial [Lacipirellulaceae bacterium]|nr:HAD hydrolase-like protein [Lacipirellulaceae bacterium]
MSDSLAVIFDVDGVLTDSYRAHFESWQRMFGELGVEFTEDTFRATFGRTNRDIFGELYQSSLSEDQIRQWGDRKEALYREIIATEFAPMPGAVELIDAPTAAGFVAMPGAVELIDALCDAGFKLGVGSSGPPENIEATLDKLGRSDRFAAVVTGADVQRGKPDPQVFLLAAER